MGQARINFVKQQGFEDLSGSACDLQYGALMFQPRLIGLLVVGCVVLQAPYGFLVLAGILWWNALTPKLNPIDWLYNHLVAAPRDLPSLTPAPGPRRFAQGMAGTFMLGIGGSLLAGWTALAWALEALLLVALGALVFGAFCLGSLLFHLLAGRAHFAKRTLPWARNV